MKIIRCIPILFLLLFLQSGAQDVRCDSLRRVLRSTKIDTAKVNVYNKLADVFKESNPDSTIFYAKRASALSLATGYDFGAGNAEINQGNAQIILGDYKSALSHFKKAQSYYEKAMTDDDGNRMIKNGLARAYASAGVVFSEQSNYYMALEHYQKALKLYREIGQKQNISKAYNNIGIVYKSQQNSKKALEYFKKAYNIQEEIGEQA
ncbi:MAG: tetratricopeptide repeat protein, partial [Flavobacterium sp.]